MPDSPEEAAPSAPASETATRDAPAAAPEDGPEAALDTAAEATREATSNREEAASIRRCVLVLLNPPVWAPPGIAPDAWRRALAEDVIDMLSGLRTDVGLVADPDAVPLAEAVRWPHTTVYEVERATVAAALSAAHRAGYQHAAVIASDAPDLPGMVVGKLLKPVGRRPVAAGPSGNVLWGVAATLPAPGWLLAADPDLDSHDLATLRAAAERPGQVAAAPSWHRLRGPDEFAKLDAAVEGWDATRALLSVG